MQQMQHLINPLYSILYLDKQQKNYKTVASVDYHSIKMFKINSQENPTVCFIRKWDHQG